MTLCGSILRVSVSCTVVLAAVLLYFHMECQKEKEEKAATTKEEFKPDKTDVEAVMGYCKEGVTLEMYIGWELLLPCALGKLVKFVKKEVLELSVEMEKDLHNVTILDARKNNPGKFHETGFTLIELEEEPVTKDWRTMTAQDPNADITHFHKQMEPHIKKLYPDIKRMVWTYNVVRGGDQFGDQPRAVGGPHLDYHQDDEARIEFHKTWPAAEGNITEPRILMGETDDEDGKLGALLGVWKPIYPAAICDFPLTVMDARTFHPSHLVPLKLQAKLWPLFTFNNLQGVIVYTPEQLWYYYPFQTTREVLIFHQYSKGKWFANPHSSFENKNCPEGSESRVSVEMSLALYF